MTDYGHIDLWDIREELMEKMMPSDVSEDVAEEVDLNSMYAAVQARGFKIDSRSVNPLLIKGQWARSFSSFREACYFALFRFDTEQ